jgi:hypothetical protein
MIAHPIQNSPAINRSVLLAAYYSPQSIDESALNHPKIQGNNTNQKNVKKTVADPMDYFIFNALILILIS